MSAPDGILRTAMGAYVLRDDTHLSRWVEKQNALDIAENVREIASFAHLIPEGGMVIDAGACLGDHTVTYSQIVGVRGQVYAFEPHPLVYEALVLNVGRLVNVTTFCVALTDKAHDKSYHGFAPEPNVGASFLIDVGPERVPCRSLDSLLAKVWRCDFIHLDAEGWEPRILEGARKLIEKFHPTMVVEVCDKHLRRAGSSEAELLALVASLGYRVEAIPEHADPKQRDVLCVWGVA